VVLVNGDERLGRSPASELIGLSGWPSAPRRVTDPPEPGRAGSSISGQLVEARGS